MQAATLSSRQAIITAAESRRVTLNSLQLEEQSRVLNDLIVRDPTLPVLTIAGNLVTNYPTITALYDANNREHTSNWQWVTREIRLTTVLSGLHRIRDRAIELDDLIQTVHVEVLRSMAGFRYQSSLRTWLQHITRQRLCRVLRDTLAVCRKGNLEAAGIDQVLEIDEPCDPSVNFDDIHSNIVLEHVESKLSILPDRRLLPIFTALVRDDLSVSMIAERFVVHDSTVRRLIKTIQLHLQDDPFINAWYRPEYG